MSGPIRATGPTLRIVPPKGRADDLVVTLKVGELADELNRAVRDAVEAKTLQSDEVLTLKEAAALMRVDRHQIPKLIEREAFPAHPLGKHWRFLRSELLAWMKSKKERI